MIDLSRFLWRVTVLTSIQNWQHPLNQSQRARFLLIQSECYDIDPSQSRYSRHTSSILWLSLCFFFKIGNTYQPITARNQNFGARNRHGHSAALIHPTSFLYGLSLNFYTHTNSVEPSRKQAR